MRVFLAFVSLVGQFILTVWLSYKFFDYGPGIAIMGSIINGLSFVGVCGMWKEIFCSPPPNMLR